MNHSFQWNKIAESDYAKHERNLGQRISEIDRVMWRQVRPFFHRPLFVLQELDPDQVRGPGPAVFGSFQHAVPEGSRANSHLNYLVFENPCSYSPATLNSERRRRIKRANAEFTITPLGDLEEFKQQVYPLYLDFIQRTGYSVGAARQGATGFARWAENLFALPGLLIIGAYRLGKLAGVSTSFRFHNTLVCATLLCATDALSHYLPDLMLHLIREGAAACPGLTQIYPGMYHGKTSLDAFYLERGARILRKLAWLQINPVGRSMLTAFRPKIYRHLIGELSTDEMKWTTMENLDPLVVRKLQAVGF